MVIQATSMKFSIPLAILIVLHIVFLRIDAYSMAHLDSLMHLTGGIVLGIFIYGVLACMIGRGWFPDPGRLVMTILIVSLVTTGAVCWEFYEWLSDAMFGTHLQHSVTDTMKDLFLGMLGGVIYTVFVFLVRPSINPAHKRHRGCKPLRSDG